MFLDPGCQQLGELAELAILQKPALDEPENLFRERFPGSADLVQDLKGDFTASGSSRHDQITLPQRDMRQRLPPRVFQVPRQRR